MSITKYRHMNYTDDGCDLYQCLNCYKTLEIRYIPDWKFCPMCGIEFSGQLKCRETHEPSWLYKLDLDYNAAYDLKSKSWKKDKAGWIIEKRTVWYDKGDDGEITYKYTYGEHPGARDWHVYQQYDNRVSKTAVEILKHLKDLRWDGRMKDEDYFGFGTIDEYRGKYANFKSTT